ncbi:MAG: restriction endonuclease [Candidatus Pacebacteria bacterium]|nr:restriction endonuclease [Candidatus Paceibacterota bacterium]
MLVTKLDGTTEEFEQSKLKHSLFNAGATEAVADEIVSRIERELRPGMTTSSIYRHAKRLLRKHTEHPVAARYSLRRAILEMGPSGYPFEKILGEVFRLKGYQVEVGRMLQGKCVEHEIDVLARNDEKLILGEAKFHNNQGFKTDVKVALYIHARFLDCQAADFAGLCPKNGACESWLITNTKFTDAAIKYGECVGIKMIGWGYPKKGNVQDLIEQTGLHPLSSLTTLSKKEKDALYAQGMVLCRNITDNPNVLESVGVTGPKVESILEEAHRLCIPMV